MTIWIKEIKRKHLLIKKSKKFNKAYGNKVSFIKFKEYLKDTDFSHLAERPAWFELYESQKIVFFAIPWGEVYCECNDHEYRELIKYIDNKFTNMNEKGVKVKSEKGVSEKVKKGSE